MAEVDIYAPPSEEELRDDLFAPPTADELGGAVEPLSELGTFAAEFGNTASMGYGPNIIAGIKTGSVTSPEYISERDRLNQVLELSKDVNPRSGYAGTAAGALSTMAIPFAGAAKGATVFNKIGRAAGLGAAAGAIQDTPEAEGQLTTPELELKERGKMAGYGAAIGAVSPMLSLPIPDEVERGFSALGPTKKAVMEALKGEKGAKNITRENVVNFAKSQGILKAGSTVETMQAVAPDVRRNVGMKLSEVYENASKIAQDKMHSMAGTSYAIGRDRLLDIKNKALAAVDIEMKSSKDKGKIKSAIAEYFDEMQDTFGTGVPDITDLHDIKMAVAKLAKYSKNAAKQGSGIADSEKAWANTERIISSEIESAIEGLAKEAPQLGAQLKQFNKEYQLAKYVEDVLDSRLAGDLSTQRGTGIFTMLTDTIQPAVDSTLSAVAGGGNVVTNAVNKALGPLAPKAQNIPFAAPLIMQQSVMSPMDRYKYEKTQGGQ